MFLLFVLSACLLLNFNVTCAPATKPEFSQIPSAQALEFMKKFGYLEEDNGESEALYTESGISNILKTVQKFGNITETGTLNNATIKLMGSPRCGVPDVIRHKRQKRYVLGSKGWEKRNLTYFIANWSPRLGEQTIAKNIQKALDTWGGYGRLYFQRVFSPAADIIVAFGTGYHGDSFPFDGPGNILAHAFFPYEYSDMGGDIHFDDDEKWIDKDENGSEDGTDFYTVALHELGHSLGLAHSPIPTSIMFPYYRGYDTNSQISLDYDDILGMYKLYINRVLKEDYNTTPSTSNDDDYESSSPSTYPTPRGTPPKRIPTETTPFDNPTSTERYPSSTRSSTRSSASTVSYHGDSETVDVHKEHDPKHHIPKDNSPSLPYLCSGHVDAMATLRNELFVFKDQFMWRFKEKGRLEPGYPIPFKQMFSNLPKSVKKIDAAYERPDGMIILFTGKMFWVHDGSNFIENSPRPLSDYGIPAYVNEIDAVQTWGRNGKTYFFKKERFWRYNETTKSMDAGYPLHMERWRGVPDNLNAATTWKDGFTYFFKNELFWKFDNDWVMVSEQSPLPTAPIWFGCPEGEQNMKRLY